MIKHRSRMTLDEIKQDDEYRQHLYVKWQHRQCCPECENDHVQMRLIGAPALKQNKKWKIDCKSCKVYWFSPELG